jgi:hypothetical protein
MQMHMIVGVGVVKQKTRPGKSVELRTDFGFKLAPHFRQKEESESGARQARGKFSV